MQLTIEEIKALPIRYRGNTYDDFVVGKVFNHHWGRTIEQSDNLAFSLSTLQCNPLYFNQPYAEADGHARIVVAPMLVFGMVFGLSVEDLSERGGAFLGVDDLSFILPVHVGDTLTARSTVQALRESKSDANYGIATWLTEGFNQRGEQVISFVRSNLVVRQGAAL
ncbi:MAG TPA: MaoC family dehydratase [Herbaspirillum sp.]|jgi:acyl dehydratase